MNRLLISVITLFAIVTSVCSAQDSVETVSLSIISNLDNSSILLDTVSLGRPPISNYKTKPGKYTITILNPKSSNKWEIENYKKEIELISDTIITVNFTEFYFINSDPFNADVFKNDTLIGMTPLRINLQYPLAGTLRFKKDEYVDEVLRLSPVDTVRNIFVKLKESRYGQSSNPVYKNKSTGFNTERNFLAISSFGAGALLSAVSSIYYKNMANDSYDTYRQTFAQKDLDNTNRYDTFSLISLLVMQGAIAGVIYFLFFD